MKDGSHPTAVPLTFTSPDDKSMNFVCNTTTNKLIDMKSIKLQSLLPEEGVVKGIYSFSLREKAGMRGSIKQEVTLFLSPHPNPLPEGEGVNETAVGPTHPYFL